MIGIISDIHANLPALKAVLEDLGDADFIVCAGDLVGYNPYPNEVVKIIKDMGIPCIRGNHDRAIIARDFSHFNPIAVEACQWTLEHLSRESMAYLASLKDYIKLNLEGKRISIHHGSPWDEDEYIYPDMVNESFLEYEESDVLIMGHTHVPFVKKFSRGIILNPGSVGQPRDGDPRASFATIDGEEVRIHRVEYDIEEVYNEILKAGLPRVLGERLYQGL